MAAVQPPRKIALSLGTSKNKDKSSTNPLKRPRAALYEAEDEENHSTKVQSVSHFDAKAGGAIDEKRPKKGPLVIKALSNRDWKAAGRQKRQKSTLPGTEDISQRIANIEAAEKKEKDRSFGLNVFKPVEKPAESLDDDMEDEAPTREKTTDERAMDALLGNETESTLVVPAISETSAFQEDFKTAPDGPTLDDYARVPVEEFGAAMLRGMGWKGGKEKKTEPTQRRPALLGIGAKSDAAIEGELGGWGKAARGKEIKIYNPVLIRDKKTGELFTEGELQKKEERDRRAEYEAEFEAKERDRERRKERDSRRDRSQEDERSYRRRDDVERSRRRDIEEKSRHRHRDEASKSSRHDDRRRHDRQDDERRRDRSGGRRYEREDDERRRDRSGERRTDRKDRDHRSRR